MRTTLHHIRANAVAYLALFVALGGTGYAATNLPAGSVGARQIKNHVIQPVKLDPSYIGGNVRMWAKVNASGRVLAGGRGMRVSSDIPGDYVLSPGRSRNVAVPRRCAVLATVDDMAGTPGSATADVATYSVGAPWAIIVETRDATGTRTALPFNVAVIC